MVRVPWKLRLAYCLIPTFNHGWEQPTDFLDVLCFTGVIAATQGGRRWLLLLVVLLGCTNHQTAAFGAVIWWVVEVRKGGSFVRESAFASLAVFLAYAETLGLRYAFTGSASSAYEVNGYMTVPHFIAWLRHPTPYGWPLLVASFAVPLGWLVAANFRRLGRFARSLLLAAALVFLLSLPIAFLSEIRSVFMCPIVLCVYAAAAAQKVDTATRRQARAPQTYCSADGELRVSVLSRLLFALSLPCRLLARLLPDPDASPNTDESAPG